MLATRERRRCFESALSAEILKNPAYFWDVINKVSSRIITLLTHPLNQAFLAENEIVRDDILLQLYSDTHFGTLSPAIEYCPSQKDFIAATINALSDNQAHLPLVLHLHQIFMQSLFDKLPFKSNNETWLKIKENLVSLLFKNELFVKSRIKINEFGGELTTKVGIAGDTICDETSTTVLHKNVIGMFAPHTEGAWAKIIEENDLPFVAGPSGHTGSAILLAQLVGELDNDELKRYLCATLGTLIGGGYHSADEVGVIASKVGNPYEPGKYHPLLPKEFLCSKPIKQLSAKYPDLLPAENCDMDHDNYLTLLINSASHGMLRGLSNVSEKVSLAHGISENTAHVLKMFLYYGSFFGMRFSEHYTQEETSDYLSVMYGAALETGELMLANVIVNNIISLCGQAGAHCKDYAKNLLSFGFFSYHAWSAGLLQTASSMMASVATQALTEKVSKRALNL